MFTLFPHRNPLTLYWSYLDVMSRCRYNVPGGTIGYPAHPRLICPSFCPSVLWISFHYSAENPPGPTDLVKYCLKIVNWRESRVRYFFEMDSYVMAENRTGPTVLVKYSMKNVKIHANRESCIYVWENSKSTGKWQMGTVWHKPQNTQFYLTKQNLLHTLFLQPTRQRVSKIRHYVYA